MTWCTTELDDAVHVHPAYESGHILGPWCWCDPDQENTDGLQMFTHRPIYRRGVMKRVELWECPECGRQDQNDSSVPIGQNGRGCFGTANRRHARHEFAARQFLAVDDLRAELEKRAEANEQEAKRRTAHMGGELSALGNREWALAYRDFLSYIEKPASKGDRDNG